VVWVAASSRIFFLNGSRLFSGRPETLNHLFHYSRFVGVALHLVRLSQRVADALRSNGVAAILPIELLSTSASIICFVLELAGNLPSGKCLMSYTFTFH